MKLISLILNFSCEISDFTNFTNNYSLNLKINYLSNSIVLLWYFFPIMLPASKQCKGG